MGTTVQLPAAQLRLLFHGLIAVVEAEKLLSPWVQQGLRVVSVSSHDDAPVFIVSVPGGEFEKWKKQIAAVPEVADVEEVVTTH